MILHNRFELRGVQHDFTQDVQKVETKFLSLISSYCKIDNVCCVESIQFLKFSHHDIQYISSPWSKK